MLQNLANSESLAIISLLAFKFCEISELCNSKDKTIADKDNKIANLEAELAKYRTPKNSGNSSLPPSTDFSPPKRNQSLRQKSNKLPGAQNGHKGTTLEMKANPDEIINHSPCTCSECGINLVDVEQVLIDKRQVIDIPPIQPIYTEHRIYRKTCSCGHVSEGAFPKEIKAPIQYGGSVAVATVYLQNRHYLPYQRLAEYFDSMMNLPISPGTLNNIVHRFAEKASVAYNAIKEAIIESKCVGSDETGAKVNGQKDWFWTWQNNNLTFIVHSKSRGFETIEMTFADGLPHTVLVSDRWAAQLKCLAQQHQICMSHLLRDLNYIEQLHDSQWATDMKLVIQTALELKKQLNENDYLLPIPARDELENKLQEVLLQPIPPTHSVALTLQKSLTKIQEYILNFLHYSFVPADNNGSERAVRNVKVKQKISGQFKSMQGADDFAVIRTIIDTAIKQGKNIYNELFAIANLVPI